MKPHTRKQPQATSGPQKEAVTVTDTSGGPSDGEKKGTLPCYKCNPSFHDWAMCDKHHQEYYDKFYDDIMKEGRRPRTNNDSTKT